ncbi:unnamed protein product [Tetraodon nigroviridis]|uniref:(spotted green pufferfish) hypothetical protein n=1 Tax=Tetraodon nigroviridis TaxID=99883 RepID=Q4RUM1_TETNG|nr:unnamed protein product [Tetraodon nigroviridis]
MVSASWDGLNYSHRELQSKEPNVATSTSLIMQAAFCVLPSRDLLVVTSQKGIQMYESDGSIMVYWHALDSPETPTAQAVFARGDLSGVGKLHLCGMSCSSVKLWKGAVVAGYGTGQIRIYEAVTGILHAEINAHARWIYSLDIAPFSGLLSGCTFAQRVCDRHTNLWSQVL